MTQEKFHRSKNKRGKVKTTIVYGYIFAHQSKSSSNSPSPLPLNINKKGENKLSVENEKVCCNCRHNIREWDEGGMCHTHCEIDGHYIDYIRCMEGWCRHWATDEAYWKGAENDALY